MMKSATWPKRKLGGLIETVSDTFRFNDQEVVFLNTSDVYDGRVLHHDFSKPQGLPGQAKKRIQRGDLLFSEIRPANRRFALVDFDADRYVVSTKLMVLRSKGEISPEYLRLVLTSQQTLDYLQRIAESRSGTFPQITFAQVAEIEVPWPSESERSNILNIVGAFDEKFEANRKANAAMATLTRALFKSWFADKSVGKLPKGWSTGKLSDIADVVMGLSPDGESYNTTGDGVPLINGPVEFGEYFPAKSKWTTMPTRMATAGDLIFCVRGSTTGRRVISDDNYCLGRGVCGIRAKNGARTFLYETINFALETMLSRTTGSVFPSLSAPDIKNFPVLIPTPNELDRFAELAEPITESVQAKVHVSCTLKELRELLLPKLLTCEIAAPAASAKEAAR